MSQSTCGKASLKSHFGWLSIQKTPWRFAHHICHHLPITSNIQRPNSLWRLEVVAHINGNGLCICFQKCSLAALQLADRRQALAGFGRPTYGFILAHLLWQGCQWKTYTLRKVISLAWLISAGRLWRSNRAWCRSMPPCPHVAMLPNGNWAQPCICRSWVAWWCMMGMCEAMFWRWEGRPQQLPIGN